MKSQNKIIYETEAAIEKFRQEIALLKKETSNPIKKRCYVNLEHILFENLVFFYTHRTIGSQSHFWDSYTIDNSIEFEKMAYNQMIKCTLINFYSCLYFCIEGALCLYFSINKPNGNILDRFKKLSNRLIT